MTDEQIAQAFHEAYERLAPDHGYKTREASAVPWEDVPAANRSLMVAVAGEVREALAAGRVSSVLEVTDEMVGVGTNAAIGQLLHPPADDERPFFEDLVRAALVAALSVRGEGER